MQDNVTQADRDRAFSTGIRLSKREWIEVYEAFAAHRLASTTDLVEAWSKRTGSTEVTGEAVPYLKVYFDSKDEVRAFNDAIRALADRNVVLEEAALHPVLVEIMAEVEKATRKFPTWPTRIIDAGNVVSEEAGELAKACLQVTYEPQKETLDGVRIEAIQTAAMAFRFLCSMDRYDVTPSHQHKQSAVGGKCNACDGRGWFSVDMMGSAFTDCDACNGTGRIEAQHKGADHEG